MSNESFKSDYENLLSNMKQCVRNIKLGMESGDAHEVRNWAKDMEGLAKYLKREMTNKVVKEVKNSNFDVWMSLE